MNAQRPSANYFSTRYLPDPARSVVWREIIRALSGYIPRGGAVLELGPGYCDFINQVPANRKIAVDIDPSAGDFAASDVELIQGDCGELSMIAAGSIDLVFASNLLEHLDRHDATRLLRSAFEVLKPGGTLMLIQPNFRYCYARYFDDYTHVTPYTDRGLLGLLQSERYRVLKCEPRFLPFSMNSGRAIPRWGWLVRLYLNLPFRPLAGQMLVVAERPSTQRGG